MNARRILLIALCFTALFCGIVGAQITKPVKAVKPAKPVLAEPEPTVFVIVEQEPVYPGGENEMNKYVLSNIRYPAICKDMEIEGRAFVEFTIDKDGSVINANILKGIPGCAFADKEALRVINSMPKWKPAKYNGRPVRYKMSVPVKFQLR